MSDRNQAVSAEGKRRKERNSYEYQVLPKWDRSYVYGLEEPGTRSNTWGGCCSIVIRVVAKIAGTVHNVQNTGSHRRDRESKPGKEE